MSCHLVLQHQERSGEDSLIPGGQWRADFVCSFFSLIMSSISCFQWKVGSFSPTRKNTRNEKSKSRFSLLSPDAPSHVPRHSGEAEGGVTGWLSTAALHPQGPATPRPPSQRASRGLGTRPTSLRWFGRASPSGAGLGLPSHRRAK